ncbi:MAG: hypothetical protein JSR24_07410 [Proteobacteria bacterium]|nr:hypothetical protein [Pseudomonadota bacterium]
MAAPRSLAFVLAGLAITGCSNVLPKPEYTYVKTPPAIRTLPDGTKVDDRGYHLDADGYRLDRRSKIIGEVEYDAKAQSTVSSNAVAGYYISSENRVAGGTVAVPSEGAGAGALPTSASYTTTSTSNVPRGTSNVPYAVPSTAPATTTPVPLAPPATR